MILWFLFDNDQNSSIKNRTLFTWEKLQNFPSVNYISLYESVDRQQYMENQLNALGIKRSNAYISERFDKLSDIKITGPCIHEVTAQFGTIIAHLNIMRNWYNSCNEPYAIFCEDDVSFESVNYWNFTWNEFMENLPSDWECVQLMRLVSPWHNDSEQYLKINLREGRWWGAHSLMRREYVKKILEKTCIGINEYHFEIWDNDILITPIIENLLFMGVGKVYNIPLLIENLRFNTTFGNRLSDSAKNQERSHRTVLNKWNNTGNLLNIKDIMSLGK